MKINDIINGFTVKNIRPIDELNGELVEMTHINTGLELVWINRKEENKTFGIAFETLPFDDTGVFHILEHSVLCGSDRYQVKEPFVELLKTSMNTFLNAMTFPDKTLYPISSRNEKDFFNLMRVYLDAVFCPSIYSKPEIFYQEGWHYELDDNDNASYKGVVFNEMKGVFASPDELEEVALNRALFPDSPYKFVSGGDPISIPELSYEEFLESHKRFYSPSNAYVFLDGSIDIERTLELIENEYLSSLDRGERLAPPAVQKAVDGGTVISEYELGEGEEPENKTRIARASVIGTFDEREKIVAMQVLADVLCGSNQSMLTKAVLKKGMAEDVVMQVCDGVFQPWVKIEMQNVADDYVDSADDFLLAELKSLADNGIDTAQLEASMANIEFQMRERDYGSMPQGLVFNFLALETWLYGGDPMKNLVIGDVFTQLKAKMKDGYFEKLLSEIIINGKHKARVVLTASSTIGEKRRQKETEKLNAEASQWSDATKKQMREKQARLEEWQSSTDTPEALATLPQLKLSDIPSKPEILPNEVCNVNGVDTLYHNVNCSGIANGTLFFDAEDLNEQEISQLSFLTDILGKMRTRKYSEEELDRLNRLLFGTLDFSVSAYQLNDAPDKCRIKLGVVFSTLEKNISQALEFVAQILTDTEFDDEAVAYDLLKQLKTKYFQQFVMSGAAAGVGRVKAQYSSSGVVNECAGGVSYYKWLCEQDKNRNWAKLKADLKSLVEKIISIDRLTVSLTSDNKNLLDTITGIIKGSINSGSKPCADLTIKPWGRRSEGIVIPADVSFACAGGFADALSTYNGSMNVASRIVSLDYLWNAIRVQGGAYGCGFRFDRMGIATSYSYRDPNASTSLEIYKNIPAFLEEFAKAQPDLTGFIIGSIAAASPLLTPKMKGMRADAEYWSGITNEDKERELGEMLATTAKDLVSAAHLIKASYENGGVCVFANRKQLEHCRVENIETL